MAAKGWQLEKITRLYWQYRRIKPQNLTYAVTYFSEASEFNPYPTDNQRTFHEYCKSAGWNFLAEWGQMQIFCSEQENPTPIETDESVKLKAIHKAMKKNFLPSTIMLLLLSIFQIYSQLYTIADDPVYQLASGLSLFAAALWTIVCILALMNLIGYALWYNRSRKSVLTGGACVETHSDGYRKANYILLGISIILALLLIMTLRYGWLAIFGIAGITILMILVFTIRNALKHAEASKRVNLAVTLISIVILSLAFTGGLTWGIMHGMKAGWFGNSPAETYTTTLGNTTYTWDIYRDPLPLTVEDLQDVEYDHYSYKWTANESFLLAHHTARQDSLPGTAPELYYSIVDVKWPALFDACLNYYLTMFDYIPQRPDEDQRHFRQTDDPAWQADAVYQMYDGDDARPNYILCRGSRIVNIRLDKIPTAQQITIAAEKLIY